MKQPCSMLNNYVNLNFRLLQLNKENERKDWRNPINSCMLIKRTYIDKRVERPYSDIFEENRLGDQTIYDSPLSDCPARNGR